MNLIQSGYFDSELNTAIVKMFCLLKSADDGNDKVLVLMEEREGHSCPFIRQAVTTLSPPD